MRKRYWQYVTLMLAGSAALLPSGCINPEKERARALAMATDRCESQGKQLHVINLSQEGADVTQFHTSVDFECVGPGEPGYVPSASPPASK